MPKNNRLDDFIKQPQLAPSAADLGMEAYQANLGDPPGERQNLSGQEVRIG